MQVGGNAQVIDGCFYDLIVYDLEILIPDVMPVIHIENRYSDGAISFARFSKMPVNGRI
jgi:hypothetical protein